jgi:pyruvate/2-oxoglutarate dehydrogenase complex dihydrolipoamide dehydrogenase (E3) component
MTGNTGGPIITPMPEADPLDVLVLGAGPAGVVAALRAAHLGARTALVTRDEFGGMAANDGPVPVRTLAHAARLLRETRQGRRYGIAGGEPTLDYPDLLSRVREVTAEARRHSLFREDLERLGVVIHERAGPARFVDEDTVEVASGQRLRADKVILCTGGAARRLPIPGFELTATHSDAWSLTAVPRSLLVLGSGATGIQVASIFHAFGSRVTIVERGPRILAAEDRDVSRAVAGALEAAGVRLVLNAGTIERFAPAAEGVRLVLGTAGSEQAIDAAVAVMAVGWVANTGGMDLDRAGVELDERGYVRVDDSLQTTGPRVWAAGDVTGRAMVVHEAVRQGNLAATNAVSGNVAALPDVTGPTGSFTDPEYASVGLTEEAAREAHDVAVATVPFSTLPRPLIDGRPAGFCKLVVDRESHSILGCHIVGERAVELAQVAATAMAGELPVETLARVPFSFPTYANALGRAAITAAAELDRSHMWAVDLMHVPEPSPS